MHNTQQEVLRLLTQRGKSFSAAESCTGGLIAKMFTDLPGASRAFVGGVVSYTNGVKHRVLGVPEEVLERCGAVSEPVAEAMARGVRHITGSDYAVSVTGLAGPEGDDRGNPVGTVFIGLAACDGTEVVRLQLSGDREAVRQQAAEHAFALLWRHLTDNQ